MLPSPKTRSVSQSVQYVHSDSPWEALVLFQEFGHGGTAGHVEVSLLEVGLKFQDAIRLGLEAGSFYLQR